MPAGPGPESPTSPADPLRSSNPRAHVGLEWSREEAGLAGGARAERRDKVPLTWENGGCESPMTPGKKAPVG